MCYLLDRIALSMGKIIHRVNAPFIPGPVMMCVLDTVKNWIPHQHIEMTHIDLRTKCSASIRKSAVLHFCKQLEVLFYAAVPERTIPAGLCRCSFHGSDLFTGTIIHVSQTFFDQLDGILVKCIEIIRSIVLVLPGKTQPANIIFDTLDVFCLFR